MEAMSPALAGVCIALVLVLVVLHRELLRRAFLRAEVPRTMGALRITFVACVLVGALEPVLEAQWLFSDEGMLLTEGAQERMAGDSLAGYSDGRFVEPAALWHYLSAGLASPLHFWDTPMFVSVWSGARAARRR